MSDTIQGYAVLEIMPDFAEAPRLAGKFSAELVDLSDAPRINSLVSRKPLHVLSHKFKFHTRADIEAYEDFFDSVAGSWLPFWLPSWHAELNATADALTSATTLQISPVNYATTYNPTTDAINDLGHYIFFLNVNGNFEIKRVLSVSGTTTETLTLDSALAHDYKIGKSIIGFLYFVRFLSDQLALDFTGATQADCDQGFLEVQEFVANIADLNLAVSTPAALLLGNTYDYTFTITNLQAKGAENSILHVTLDPALTFVSATGGVTPSGGVLTFSLGTISSTDTVVIVVTFSVPTATNTTTTANVTTDTTELTTANNSVTVNQFAGLTDWAQRVVINGGAQPSSTTINAMETFRLAMISAGLDSKMHSLCIFVPDSLTAALTPLFHAKGNDPWTNHNFVTGDLTTEGLKGNGTTKYLDSGVKAKSGEAINSGNAGLTCIVTQANSNVTECEMGHQDSGSSACLQLQVSGGGSGGASYFIATGISGTTPAQVTDWDRSGYVSGNTISGTVSLFKASPEEAHATLNTSSFATSATGSNETIFGFCANIAGTASAFSGKRISVMAIHDGLTSTQSATFWGLLKTLRDSLGGGNGSRVENWAAKVVRLGGAAPTTGTKTALKTFYAGLDTDGILSKITALNAYVPDSLTAAITPLIWNAGNESWTNHNFVSGDITTTGIKGNGTTKYLDTGIITSSANNITATSAGISIIISNIPTSANIYDLGVGGSGNSSQFALLNNAGTIFFYCWKFSGSSGTDFVSFAAPGGATWAGYLSGNRTASNAIAVYRASTSLSHALGGSGTGAQTGGTIASFALAAGAINALGSLSSFSTHSVSFLAIHGGLTLAQSANMYARAATLRTALGGGNP